MIRKLISITIIFVFTLQSTGAYALSRDSYALRTPASINTDVSKQITGAMHEGTNPDAGMKSRIINSILRNPVLVGELKKLGFDEKEIAEKAAQAADDADFIITFGFKRSKASRDQMRLLRAYFRVLINEKVKRNDRNITLVTFGLGRIPSEAIELLRAFYEELQAAEKENTGLWKIKFYGVDYTNEALEWAEEAILNGLKDVPQIDTVIGPDNVKVVKGNVYDLEGLRQVLKEAGEDVRADIVFERNLTYANIYAIDGALTEKIKRGNWEALKMPLMRYLASRNILLAVGKKAFKGEPGTLYVTEPQTKEAWHKISAKAQARKQAYAPAGTVILTPEVIGQVSGIDITSSMEIKEFWPYGAGMMLYADNDALEKSGIAAFQESIRNSIKNTSSADFLRSWLSGDRLPPSRSVMVIQGKMAGAMHEAARKPVIIDKNIRQGYQDLEKANKHAYKVLLLADDLYREAVKNKDSYRLGGAIEFYEMFFEDPSCIKKVDEQKLTEGIRQVVNAAGQKLQKLRQILQELREKVGDGISKPTLGHTMQGRLIPLQKRLVEKLKAMQADKKEGKPLVVVDLGIGENGAPTTFDFIEMLREEGFSNVVIYGVDINQAYVSQARKELSKIKLAKGIKVEFKEGGFNLKKLGLSDADMVIASNVFLGAYYRPSEQKEAIKLLLGSLGEKGVLVVNDGPFTVEEDMHFRIYRQDGSQEAEEFTGEDKAQEPSTDQITGAMHEGETGNKPFDTLMEEAKDAMRRGDFSKADRLLANARVIAKPGRETKRIEKLIEILRDLIMPSGASSRNISELAIYEGLPHEVLEALRRSPAKAKIFVEQYGYTVEEFNELCETILKHLQRREYIFNKTLKQKHLLSPNPPNVKEFFEEVSNSKKVDPEVAKIARSYSMLVEDISKNELEEEKRTSAALQTAFKNAANEEKERIEEALKSGNIDALMKILWRKHKIDMPSKDIAASYNSSFALDALELLYLDALEKKDGVMAGKIIDLIIVASYVDNEHALRLLGKAAIDEGLSFDELLAKRMQGQEYYKKDKKPWVLPGFAEHVEKLKNIKKLYSPPSTSQMTGAMHESATPDLQMFFNDPKHRVFPRMLETGAQYGPTPYILLPMIFENIKYEIGDLSGKKLLDFGAGGLKASLYAAVRYKMKSIAIERDEEISKKGQQIYDDAIAAGLIKEGDIKYTGNADAFDVPWKDFDVVYFYYTEPMPEGDWIEFRAKFKQKMAEMKKGSVVVLLFLSAYLDAKDSFKDVENDYPVKEIGITHNNIPYYLKIFSCGGAEQIAGAMHGGTYDENIIENIIKNIEDDPGSATAENLRLLLVMLPITPDFIRHKVLQAMPYFVSANKASFTAENLFILLEMLRSPDFGTYIVALEAIPYFLQANKASFTPENFSFIYNMLRTPFASDHYTALRVLPYFIKADKAFATPKNLSLVLKILESRNFEVSYCALMALPFFIQADKALLSMVKEANPLIENTLSLAYPNPDKKTLAKTFISYSIVPQDGLSLGAQQFIKMYLYSALKDNPSLTMEDAAKHVEEDVVPGLRILEVLGDSLPNMGAEISQDGQDVDSLKTKERLSNFLMQVMLKHEVGPSKFDQEKNHLELRILPSTYPIIYLNLLMHLKLGLLDKKSCYATTIQGALNQEAFFILCLSMFSITPLAKLPEGLKPAPNDTIDFANTYQSYIGQTINPKTGELLSNETQTYLYDRTFLWVEPFFKAYKQQQNFKATVSPGEETTPEHVMSAILRMDFEMKAYLGYFAYQYLKDRASPQAKAYKEFKSKIAGYLLQLKDEQNEQLLTQEEVAIIVGEKETSFYFSGERTPYKLNEENVRVILSKLMDYFNKNKEELYGGFRNTVNQAMADLKKAYDKEYPLAEEISVNMESWPMGISVLAPQEDDLIQRLYSSELTGNARIQVIKLLGATGAQKSLKALAPLTKQTNPLETKQAAEIAMKYIQQRQPEVQISGAMHEDANNGSTQEGAKNINPTVSLVKLLEDKRFRSFNKAQKDEVARRLGKKDWADLVKHVYLTLNNELIRLTNEEKHREAAVIINKMRLVVYELGKIIDSSREGGIAGAMHETKSPAGLEKIDQLASQGAEDVRKNIEYYKSHHKSWFKKDISEGDKISILGVVDYDGAGNIDNIYITSRYKSDKDGTVLVTEHDELAEEKGLDKKWFGKVIIDLKLKGDKLNLHEVIVIPNVKDGKNMRAEYIRTARLVIAILQKAGFSSKEINSAVSKASTTLTTKTDQEIPVSKKGNLLKATILDVAELPVTLQNFLAKSLIGLNDPKIKLKAPAFLYSPKLLDLESVRAILPSILKGLEHSQGKRLILVVNEQQDPETLKEIEKLQDNPNVRIVPENMLQSVLSELQGQDTIYLKTEDEPEIQGVDQNITITQYILNQLKKIQLNEEEFEDLKKEVEALIKA